LIAISNETSTLIFDIDLEKTTKGQLQSDTEMLSVSVVEEYATQNHMAVDLAYELFHRYQL
jgi:hypothetical protein